MQILILCGTPKADGITRSFVDAAAQTAREMGCEAEVLELNALGLSACKMCGDGWGTCASAHNCSHANDFATLREKVRTADAFIYITPVYWGEASEAMKNFIDKLRRCEGTKQWSKEAPGDSFHKGKPAIIVANAGGGGGGILSTLQSLERAVQSMHGHVFDYVAVNRWNAEYKRAALREAVIALHRSHMEKKEKNA